MRQRHRCGSRAYRTGGRGRASAVLLAGVLLGAAAPCVPAHVREVAGPYELELGWRDEPPYSGAPNAIELRVASDGGAGVADPRASLRVEVRFGATRRVLALRPGSRRGTYSAAIVPTRPGVYGLRASGRVRGRRVAIGATCSERTFDCVSGADAIQFPVAEPSGGQVDRKVERALARAARSADRADRASKLAMAALAVAATALLVVVGGVLVARRRRV
jgi:hypothetical protein